MTRKKGNPRNVLPYRGKPLSTLLKDLPNHGVGRLIIRGSSKQIDGEPSYMRILKVDMAPVVDKKKKNKAKREKRSKRIKMVRVERTYRGFIQPKPVNLSSTSHLADFLLVSKAEEHKYLENSVPAFNKKHFFYTSSQKIRIQEMILSGITPVEAKRIERERALDDDFKEAQRMADDHNDDDGENGNENSSEDSQEFDKDVRNCETNNEEEPEETRPERYDNQQLNYNKKMEGRREHTERMRLECYDNQQLNYNENEEKRGMNTEEQVQIDSNSWYEEEKFADFTEDQMHRINNMMSTGMNSDTAKQIEWERDQAFKIAAANDSMEEEKRDTFKTTTCQPAEQK